MVASGGVTSKRRVEERAREKEQEREREREREERGRKQRGGERESSSFRGHARRRRSMRHPFSDIPPRVQGRA